MLKITPTEKKILDGLLTKTPKVVANTLKVHRQKVYSTKHYFLRKVQNAEEFLAVARGTYKPLLSRRLKTPKIMPREPDEETLFDTE